MPLSLCLAPSTKILVSFNLEYIEGIIALKMISERAPKEQHPILQT